jgi:hypothetical protein
MVRFVLITGKEREPLEFQAIGGGKNAWFPRKGAIGKNILVDIKMYFVI